MKEAVIVSAVRTAVGKAPKGTLKNTRPDDLGAAAIKEAVERVPGLDKSQIEDVIMGWAFPEAEQGMNVVLAARSADKLLDVAGELEKGRHLRFPAELPDGSRSRR